MRRRRRQQRGGAGGREFGIEFFARVEHKEGMCIRTVRERGSGSPDLFSPTYCLMDPPPEEPPPEEKQCRICLAGVDEVPELGRLFRPCMCKGSIAYVHVQCLNEWRKVSASRSAYWQCPQCHYKYNIARTRAVGIAESSIILGASSIILFVTFVFLASFVVSIFISKTPSHSDSYTSYWYSSPITVVNDIIKLAVTTFAEELDDNPILTPKIKYRPIPQDGRGSIRSGPFKSTIPMEVIKPTEPGVALRLLRRFIMGLSLVGILSFVNILVSFSLLGTMQLANWRVRRDGRGKNVVTMVIVMFVIVGVVKALYDSYRLTNSLAHFLLTRAETAILEVQAEDPPPAQQHNGAPWRHAGGFTGMFTNLRRRVTARYRPPGE